jgi:hypothetical protein
MREFEYKGYKVQILRVGDLKERNTHHWEKWTFSIDGKVDWCSVSTSAVAKRVAKEVINRK